MRSLASEIVRPRRRWWRAVVVVAAVAATLGVTAGFARHAEAVRVARMARRVEAAHMARRLRDRAYTSWRAEHGDSCPTDVTALLGYAGLHSDRDPWGHPYRFVCTKDPGDEYILSAGPDGEFGTSDDISYPPREP
jgi:hypothetical protein